eukprot:scaffold1954_cov268-Pinguiococcus_pyrenoidosus.AAC.76
MSPLIPSSIPLNSLSSSPPSGCGAANRSAAGSTSSEASRAGTLLLKGTENPDSGSSAAPSNTSRRKRG